MFLPWKHLTRFLKPDYKWTHERDNNFISQLDSSCTNLGIDGSFIATGTVRWVLGASIKLKFLVILRYEGWLIIFYCWLFFIENFTTFCCSLAQLCPTVHDPMKCSMLGLPVPHHLLEFAQVHPHCISDAIQPSHPVMPSSPSALNLSQHQELFQWVICSYQMTIVMEVQFQHQSFQWTFRVDLP